MKIALVTTPTPTRSGIGDYTRHLLPYLRQLAEVELFVEIGREREETGGETLRSLDELEPREFDQILYQLGNESQHAFMLPMIEALGGTVVLHDWILFDLVMSAHPCLERGGLRGLRRALREGGLGQTLTYLKNKRQPDPPGGGSVFSSGWHDPETNGRWSASWAKLEVDSAEALRIEGSLPAGRELRLHRGGAPIGSWVSAEDCRVESSLEASRPGAVELEVRGLSPTREQRENGDTRELGFFLRRAEVQVEGAWSRLDWREEPAHSARGLSRDRFALAFNRSVVRHADGFLVHSDWVGEQVLASRNAPTPIGRVHHGVEERWNEEDPREARRALGLSDDWESAFVIASLGALQAHKRPGVVLEALSLARSEGTDARLIWVGEERPAEFDLRAALERLDLRGAVHITGYLPDERAWSALRAADLCINLRGPSTGGTSGGAAQALSVGRPVVVSDLPENIHWPASCVMRLDSGADEVSRLAGMVTELASEPTRMRSLEDAARTAVRDELHWRLAAKRYIEVLETFPHPRAARRSFAVRLLQARAREKAARGVPTS